MSIESLVTAQSEFSTYFTENEFEEPESKRLFLMPLEASIKQASTISVQQITVEKCSNLA